MWQMQQRSEWPPEPCAPAHRARRGQSHPPPALLLTALLLGSLAASPGCKKSPGAASALAGNVGKLLAAGPAADLRLTPNGKLATYLTDAQKPRLEGVPPQMVIGKLHGAPTAGGRPRHLGDGVTNVPGGHLFSPDSRWVLFLAGYNAASQTGELRARDLSDDASPSIALGARVSYALVSPDSRWVALVDGSILKVGLLPKGPFDELAAEVSTAEFTPDSRTLIAKRRVSAGGSLLAVRLGQKNVRKLADRVGDYSVSPDSRRIAFARQGDKAPGTYDLFLSDLTDDRSSAVRVANDTGLMAFSPDGEWLARAQSWNVEQARGDLYIGPAAGGPGRKIGENVGERLAFAPDSKAIAYLELWSQPTRTGLMGVTGLPDGRPRQVGGRVPNFSWGSDSTLLAFLSRVVKPAYSVDLMLYRAGEQRASRVHPGVYVGYGFGPKNSYLLFRGNCIRNNRACDLFFLDLTRPNEEPRKIVEGIYSFKSSERGDRILVTYARVDTETFDLAMYNLKSGEHRTLDRNILLPALFTSNDGSSVAYIVAGKERAGVYLAEGVP
jgi:hypothetical protein